CRNIGKVLDNLHSNRPIARHDIQIVECMNINGIDARISAAFERLPPLVERDFDDPGTQPLNGLELGFRSRFSGYYGASNAEIASFPGHALSHVARRGGKNPAAELLCRNVADCIGRSANLERPDGLQVLELEIYLGRRISSVELDQGSPDR